MSTLRQFQNWVSSYLRRGAIPAIPLTIVVAGIVGVICGFGSVLFTQLILLVQWGSVNQILTQAAGDPIWRWALCLCPAVGLVIVSWFTRRYAPEAEGHGVPEVMTAIARHDGVIRPRVPLVKILASGLCIGTGGSIGREGAIVQIGSSLGSVFGQIFQLSARNIKVLVAAGAAAGISATFHAPIAGVIFASEIILANFAVESLTPIVIASVLADVVQQHYGEHGLHSAFRDLNYKFVGAWERLPAYLLLGLICGLMAVGFTKLLYFIDAKAQKWVPKWWLRALVCGGVVGLSGAIWWQPPPDLSEHQQDKIQNGADWVPALFGVGYEVIDHSLHLENLAEGEQDSAGDSQTGSGASETSRSDNTSGTNPNEEKTRNKSVRLTRTNMVDQLWWLLPLVLLKPVMTSVTLAGGGSGGIFAPSLFIGATLGASFGVISNLIAPELSASPGVYAIVGMGAVVAGTTHGVLSAILIVYEMTNDYQVILPIMAAAGLSSIVARFIDPESIYEKKLSLRGESISRGHDTHRMEHVMVRDVMIRDFPTVRATDDINQIVRVARANSHIESLPVMRETDEGLRLVGIIRPEDLHRVLDSDISPNLINAADIALTAPVSVAADENLLEVLRDFGARDVETLPVEENDGDSRRLIGLVQRSDVMRRYRVEMLRRR